MGALLERATSGGQNFPDTLPGLLRSLHIETHSAHRLHPEVRHWLDDHEPSPPLRLSIRANGFGLLLSELDAARGCSARQ